jgi:hypothetical protein
MFRGETFRGQTEKDENPLGFGFSVGCLRRIQYCKGKSKDPLDPKRVAEICVTGSLEIFIGVWRGVSKGVEYWRRPPTLWAGHP